jgi:hypothetical protein
MPISIINYSLVGGVRCRDAYDEDSASGVDTEGELYKSKRIYIRY